jgi:hypothetical protein
MDSNSVLFWWQDDKMKQQKQRTAMILSIAMDYLFEGQDCKKPGRFLIHKNTENKKR